MCGRKNAIICISVCVFVCVRGYVNVLDMTIECIVVVSQDLNQRDVNVDREPVFFLEWTRREKKCALLFYKTKFLKKINDVLEKRCFCERTIVFLL